MDAEIAQIKIVFPGVSKDFSGDCCFAQHSEPALFILEPIADTYQHPFGYIEVGFSGEGIKAFICVEVGF
jgi:hypothetical protein